MTGLPVHDTWPLRGDNSATRIIDPMSAKEKENTVDANHVNKESNHNQTKLRL